MSREIVESKPVHRSSSRESVLYTILAGLLLFGLLAYGAYRGWLWLLDHAPAFFGANWLWLVPTIIIVVLGGSAPWTVPYLWRGFRAWKQYKRECELHEQEVKDRKMHRNLIKTAVENGMNVELSNSRTGEQVKVQHAPGGRITAIRMDDEEDDENVIDADPQRRQIAAASKGGQGQEQRMLPKVEMFYDLIPYNSLQVGLGEDLVTRKPLLAEILKSTHFKFVGGSDTGKSCIAGALLDIATTTNDREHLQIGLLDLEYKTCRLFENLSHVAELGPRRQRLIGRNPDEVAKKLGLLKEEMNRRARLSEHDLQKEPVLLVYVEEMLALKYEVEEEKIKQQMLADINILGVRARKYRIFLLTVMQIDYSDKSTREAMNMFRTRGGFALEPNAAKASGFYSTDLVKSIYAQSQQGHYVLEKPGYAGIALAPDYDVRAKVLALSNPRGATTLSTTRPTTVSPNSHYATGKNGLHYDVNEAGLQAGVVGRRSPTTGELISPVASQQSLSLTEQEWRIIEKYRGGMGIKALIESEFTNSKGDPLTGGDLFTQKAKEIQVLIARFLPLRGMEE